MQHQHGLQAMHCANCGIPLQGEFCHGCGQSSHSVLKPVHGMLEETVETLFHIDGRIVHTLPPLLLKPGFLTLEYFSGRRVRYIAPFRLMFVLSLLSFFVLHLAFDQIGTKYAQRHDALATLSGDTFAQARTAADVQRMMRKQLHDVRQIGIVGLTPQVQLDQANARIRQRANQRLLQLGAAPLPAASAALPAPDARTSASPDKAAPPGKPFDIGWLPNLVNARLNEIGSHIRNNYRTFRDGDAEASAEAKQRMINGVFSVLPPTMFVLVPVFALLLKLFYVFRRRLYMEHLIVALNSHAFIFLNILLITLAGMLSTWLRPHAPWVGYGTGLIQGALIIWMPTYLLIMQKRIYRQGWLMTIVKFWFVGWCYFWLLMLALVVAATLGMAH